MRPSSGDRERPSAGRVQAGGTPPSDAQRRKPVPPDKTHAEEYYYVKQMNARTPMVVVLEGNEELHGWVEWYDQECIKLNREDGPNLLVYKRHIRYIYKDPSASQGE